MSTPAGGETSAPAAVWRTRVGFVLVSVVATALDLWMTIPPPEERVGHHYLLWGRLDVSVTTVLLVMAPVWLALLLHRRRYPLQVLAAISAASVALSFSHGWAQPVCAALLLLYTAARDLTTRPAVVALVIGMAPLISGVGFRALGYDPLGVVVATVFLASVVVGVWFLGRREHAANRTASQLRGEIEALSHEVAAQERQRIARELHDILAHSVSAMMMQAAGAKALARRVAEDQGSDERLSTVASALSTIETTGSQSMRELHRLLGALRGDGDGGLDVVLDGPRPGVGDIGDLAALTRRSGLVVQEHVSGEEFELDPSVGLAGYRFVQESLANAMKHAGRGAVVDIFTNWQSDRLQLQVRSRSGHEGTRPGTPGGGTGLVGLRQRVELVGGTFESGWVGEEFVTNAVLPLTPPQSDAGNGRAAAARQADHVDSSQGAA